MLRQKGLQNIFIRGLLAILLILVLLCGVAFIPYMSEELINRSRLYLMNNQFAKVSHPNNSHLLKHAIVIGDTGGSQCCCVLFVGDLRQYSGNQQDITNFYLDKGVYLGMVKDTHIVVPNGYESLTILPQGYDGMNGKTGFYKWDIPSIDQYSNLYVVYLSASCRDTYR